MVGRQVCKYLGMQIDYQIDLDASHDGCFKYLKLTSSLDFRALGHFR